MFNTISSTFKINPKKLEKIGIVDANLNVDTPLFIDPMLLIESQHIEFSDSAHERFYNHIKKIIKLISQSRVQNDVAWKGASSLLDFGEMEYTCLGYGSSTKGTGFSRELKATILTTIKQITELEIDDPELFLALPLFESGVGADSISDFTANIIIDDIINFNRRALKGIGLKGTTTMINGREVEALINPYSKTPLLLVPKDIVRDLPIATSWSDISRVVKANDNLREQVNASIGEVFATMNKQAKQRVKSHALAAKSNFGLLLKSLKLVEKNGYDFENDRRGYFIGEKTLRYLQDHQSDITTFSSDLEPNSPEWLSDVVKQIISQFTFLIEDNGLWKLLYDKGENPRHELAGQLIFLAVAAAFCEANDLDLSPESNRGNGPVDFKISKGNKLKAVVEVKLSTNSQAIHGYKTQLEIYKAADKTSLGFFILIDVGKLGNKLRDINKVRNDRINAGLPASIISYVDALPKESASKRKS